MATRKKKSNSSWLSLVLGMMLGVAAAVAVALFVTQAPMPFKDKASRNDPTTLLPDVKNAPDPNIALYGKDGPAGTRTPAQGGSALTPPGAAPAPGQPQEPLTDAINQIIAGLDQTSTPAAAPTAPASAPAAPKPITAPDPAKPAVNLPAPPPPPPANKPAANTQTTYYLQTGAFRSAAEAQTMLARVVMLGLPVRIEAGESNGASINRVRVGPFKGIDDMNRARTKLGDEKIESTVVRP
ncbi:SPOR domain-containing protein [Castellaniella sp.]|uniref:SPOR domain-containing protein n=1 Tax=Castellaniella sp. TaxID=1955812 RepID=UPI002AFF6D69|nr:SPOR domain-containing protein [Castellaniella sp.]